MDKTDEAARLTIAVADRAIAGVGPCELLSGPCATAANSFEKQDIVLSRPFSAVTVADGQAYAELPPLSFAALTLRLGG